MFGQDSNSKQESSEDEGFFGPKSNKTIMVAQDDGEGNWLVSYADMMTLLFGFFVILSAMSTPNAEKVEQIKKATAESMGGAYTKPFEELSKSITNVLKDINLDKDVSVVETEDGVKITSKGTLFFDSGSAELRDEARFMMDNLSALLVKQAQGFKIIVEGHTDDVPIASMLFPSNWQLSSARAGTIVQLLESKGFHRNDLRPLGLADTEPLVPNKGPSGDAIPANQAENRRIVIRLQRHLVKGAASPSGGSR